MNVVKGAKMFARCMKKLFYIFHTFIRLMKPLQPYERQVWTYQLQHARHASSNVGTLIKSCATRQQAIGLIGAATTSTYIQSVWLHLSIILHRFSTMGIQEQ